MIVLKSVHKVNPFRLNLGGKVYCVGGGFTVRKTPPALPLSLNECTQEEYQYLYDNGYQYLFDVVTPEIIETVAEVETVYTDNTEAETNTEKVEDEPKLKSGAKHRVTKSAS